MRASTALIVVTSIASFAACDASESAPPTGDFAVALGACAPGVADICYRVSVFGDTLDGEPFAQERVCASAQDALTDASLTVSCDPSDGGASRIETVVERIVIDGVDVQSTLEVPCRAPGECITEARCTEDATTEVAIPLRLVERDFVDRLAGLHPPFGFDDVPVVFDDLWLSAKVDSTPVLLYDGPERAPTIVLAVSSMTGAPTPDEQVAPHVYFSDVRIVCDSGHVSRFDPSADGDDATDATDALSFGHRVYHGVEPVYDTGVKVYWNIAIGIRVDEAYRLVAGDLGSCRLQAEASANHDPFAQGADGWSVSPAQPTRVARFDVPVIVDGKLVADVWPLESNPTFDAACRAEGPAVTDFVVDAPFCHGRAPDGTISTCVVR